MIRRGDVAIEEGLVTAVEDGEAKGVRVTVELDEPLARVVAIAFAADRRKTATFYLTPDEWKALLRDEAGGAVDGLLARRFALDVFPGRRV